MKNAFQPSLIGLIMLTVTLLVTGATTIGQKGVPHPCFEDYKQKNGKCNKEDCIAECARKRNGIGSCGGMMGFERCFCFYQKNKKNSCLP
ncbi:hypothetical protein YC2023_055688 [Brassica napus]